MPPTVPTVFISYSHEDTVWKNRLLPHLRISQREGLLEIWDDRRIEAGSDWRSEIQKAIDTADIGILLISADFLVSDFIRDEEIPRMLEQRSKNRMRLFPVLVRACDWQIIPWLEAIQIRPTGARPLAGFVGNRRDEEMAAIAREVREILASKAVAPSPSQPVLAPLHQLPIPPADFTGREEDLEFLRSRLAEGGTGAIFGLRGMGGVGKTTLALKLADELKPRFPDAQIYLDLKGVDPQPLTAAQAMAHVIRSFHPEARLPESETELTPLYRSVLDKKRVLLLMDNAARDKKQVEPLIPPPACLLLVTSRFRFSLPGLVDRDLDEMSEKDARDLLLRIASRIGDAADEIAHLCGCLPLALRLAGSSLAERLDLSPAEYIRRFRVGKEKLERVETALQTSYDLLPEKRQRLWRLLSVFPETFDLEAAAAVWELEQDDASVDLVELVLCSLVDWEETEGRYRLHDLARAFAGEKITDMEQAEVQRRHAEHFLEVLRFADSLYRKGGQESRLGLALFDREWSNIRVGQAWAAAQFRDHKLAADLCNGYPAAGAYCLDLRLHPREMIRWLNVGIEASRYLEDREVESHHLGNLGMAYKKLGETRRAIELNEQCLTIARDVGDRRGEGNCLNNLGLAYADLGETRRAIEFYEQCFTIVRDVGDRRAEGNALGNLGIAYANLGDPRRAIEFYEQWLTIARDIGDRRAEGNALGNLGIAYKNLGDPQRSIGFYDQQLTITRDIGDRTGEGNALGSLGIAYWDLGEPRRAIEFFDQQLTIARDIGDRRGEGSALGSLGIAYLDLGEPRRAIELYEQWLTIARDTGNRRGEGKALGSLGNAYAALGEPRRAIEFYEQCLTIARDIGDRRGEGTTLGNLGIAYVALGEPRRAIELYEQDLTIARDIGDRRGEGNTLGNLGVTYEVLGDSKRAIEFYEQWLTIAREIGNRREESFASWNLGLALEKEGELTRAADLMQACVDYEFEIGHPDTEEDAAHVAALRARIADAARD